MIYCLIINCNLKRDFKNIVTLEEGIFFFFLWVRLQHMKVPRLGVKLELQLQAYTTATATLDPSCICDCGCSL